MPRSRPSRSLARDAAEVLEALQDLVRAVQFRDRNRICCRGISVSQCHALRSAARRGAATLTEVAEELRLDKSTASRVVDSLERKGLVRRDPHPGDGRAALLRASPRGLSLLRGIEGDLLEEQKRILAPFPPGVRRAAARLLARLALASAERIRLDAAREGPSRGKGART